ncbi:MAG: methyltransferase dimerization domain-containing protein, partial [Pseudomonadota bacterium]
MRQVDVVDTDEATTAESRISGLINGYIASAVFFACEELGVFDAFSGKALSISELAQQIGVDAIRARRIASFLSNADLIKAVDDGRFQMTASASALLA